MRSTRIHLLAACLPMLLQAACGYCDGAIRKARAQHAEWWGGQRFGGKDLRPKTDLPQPVVIEADETFRIRADGPKRPGPEILALSGVGPKNWILVEDRTGMTVPADITGDSGGHMCLNGAGFTLRPKAPLRPGTYTLVLYLDTVRWPLVELSERRRHQGRPALVRRYRVAQ